jgi:cytochrome P450
MPEARSVGNLQMEERIPMTAVEQESIDDDLFSASAIDDPYTYLGRLRETDPVHWNEIHRVWIVTRYNDVVHLTSHPELFSSAIVNTEQPPYPPIAEEDAEELKFVRSNVRRRLTHLDPPEHAAKRRAIRPFFVPAAIEQWRNTIRETIVRLLENVGDSRQMNVLQDFAVPLPLGVISELMAVPEEDRLWVRTVAEDLLIGPHLGKSRMRETADAIRKMTGYLAPLADERLRHPGGDLISQVMNGVREGVFDRTDALQNLVLLIVAGHETTINLICNSVVAFARHPDQWDRLRADPNGLTGLAVEECLRYDPPVKSIERVATADTELNGKLIRAGERVRWFISSANRDPSRFPSPDTFDIGRKPNPHVGFGRGMHACLGAPLARLEAQEVFKEFAYRFPRFALVNDRIEYMPAVDLRVPKNVVVAW